MHVATSKKFTKFPIFTEKLEQMFNITKVKILTFDRSRSKFKVRTAYRKIFTLQ